MEDCLQIPTSQQCLHLKNSHQAVKYNYDSKRPRKEQIKCKFFPTYFKEFLYILMGFSYKGKKNAFHSHVSKAIKVKGDLTSLSVNQQHTLLTYIDMYGHASVDRPLLSSNVKMRQSSSFCLAPGACAM